MATTTTTTTTTRNTQDPGAVVPLGIKVTQSNNDQPPANYLAAGELARSVHHLQLCRGAKRRPEQRQQRQQRHESGHFSAGNPPLVLPDQRSPWSGRPRHGNTSPAPRFALSGKTFFPPLARLLRIIACHRDVTGD